MSGWCTDDNNKFLYIWCWRYMFYHKGSKSHSSLPVGFPSTIIIQHQPVSQLLQHVSHVPRARPNMFISSKMLLFVGNAEFLSSVSGEYLMLNTVARNRVLWGVISSYIDTIVNYWLSIFMFDMFSLTDITILFYFGKHNLYLY